eukprot:15445873-Alexandrium_andersonii.AAC.1
MLDKAPRYLPPCSATEFYETYTSCEKNAKPASYATFQRGVRSWSKVLKLRTLSQHARCTVCAKLAKIRKDASTQKEKDG